MKLLNQSVISKQITIKGSERVMRFVRSIRGKKTIDDAVRLSYDGEVPTRKKHLDLIEKTNQHIIKSVLIDSKSQNLHHKTYKNLYRYLAAFKILKALNLRNDAIQLAEWALPKSMRFQVTEVTMLLSIELRQYYSIVEGQKKYEKYAEICDKAIDNFQAEQKAERFYSKIVSNFARTQGETDPNILKEIDEYLLELETIESSTYRFKFLYFYLKVLREQLYNNHISIIESCDKASSYFATIPFELPYSVRFSFLFKSIPSHILLSSFETVQDSIQKAICIIPEKGTLNELICYKYMVIGGFHHSQYDYTFEGLEKAASYKKKPEEWEIFEAYCHILNISGKVEYAKSKRIGKLMNEVPTLTKDKRGLYVNLLFIQTIHWLLKKDYGKIIDRLDAMKTYQSKYINRSPFNQTRLRCFFLMLRKIGQCAFQKEESIQQTAKLLEELKASPLQENWGNVDIEIFPLETLWEIVVENLID